jgi:hypothetical protein
MGPTYITRNTVFAATAGAKTVLKLVSPTSFHIYLVRMRISMDGVTSSAVPATFDVFTSDETTAGTGSGSAVTTQINGRAQAHGLTVTQNHSAEGTTYTVLDSFYIPQFMGHYTESIPLGIEYASPGDAADSIGIRGNVSAPVNILCSLTWKRGS